MPSVAQVAMAEKSEAMPVLKAQSTAWVIRRPVGSVAMGSSFAESVLRSRRQGYVLCASLTVKAEAELGEGLTPPEFRAHHRCHARDLRPSEPERVMRGLIRMFVAAAAATVTLLAPGAGQAAGTPVLVSGHVYWANTNSGG